MTEKIEFWFLCGLGQFCVPALLVVCCLFNLIKYYAWTRTLAGLLYCVTSGYSFIWFVYG